MMMLQAEQAVSSDVKSELKDVSDRLHKAEEAFKEMWVSGNSVMLESHIHGFGQDCGNFSVLAMELP